MADKRSESIEREGLAVVTYPGGRREVIKVKSRTSYGGKPLHTREEVEEFLRKRRESEG